MRHCLARLSPPPRPARAQGEPYSFWRLSDLKGTDVALLLFGKAHKELYREVGRRHCCRHAAPPLPRVAHEDL
jgi:hypothetical protein